MNQTEFSWLDVSQIHHHQKPTGSSDLIHDNVTSEKGCERARVSAQICLWQSMARDKCQYSFGDDNGCDGGDPSPWKWHDEVGRRNDARQVIKLLQTATWPVLSWSRACPRFEGHLHVNNGEELERYVRRPRNTAAAGPVAVPVELSMAQLEWGSNLAAALAKVEALVTSLDEVHGSVVGNWMPSSFSSPSSDAGDGPTIPITFYNLYIAFTILSPRGPQSGRISSWQVGRPTSLGLTGTGRSAYWRTSNVLNYRFFLLL